SNDMRGYGGIVPESASGGEVDGEPVAAGGGSGRALGGSVRRRERGTGGGVEGDLRIGGGGKRLGGPPSFAGFKGTRKGLLSGAAADAGSSSASSRSSGGRAVAAGSGCEVVRAADACSGSRRGASVPLDAVGSEIGEAGCSGCASADP